MPTEPPQWNCFDEQKNKPAKLLFFPLHFSVYLRQFFFMLLTDTARLAKLSAWTRNPEGCGTEYSLQVVVAAQLSLWPALLNEGVYF